MTRSSTIFVSGVTNVLVSISHSQPVRSSHVATVNLLRTALNPYIFARYTGRPRAMSVASFSNRCMNDNIKPGPLGPLLFLKNDVDPSVVASMVWYSENPSTPCVEVLGILVII